MRYTNFACLLVSLVPLFVGCAPDPTDCADCSGCGFAGPVQNPGQDIYVREHGLTDAGIAAVDLSLQEGECNGADQKAFRVSYDAGVVTVSASDGAAKLDTAATSYEDGRFIWNDRSLSMAFQRELTTIELTFFDGGAGAFTVSCVGADHTVTCLPK